MIARQICIGIVIALSIAGCSKPLSSGTNAAHVGTSGVTTATPVKSPKATFDIPSNLGESADRSPRTEEFEKVVELQKASTENPILTGSSAGIPSGVASYPGPLSQSVYAFFDGTSAHQTFGRYTYLIFMRTDERAVAMLDEVFASTISAYTSYDDPLRLNVIEIPVYGTFWKSSVWSIVRTGHDDQSSKELVNQYYNRSLGESILESACADPDVRTRFCGHEFSQGPYFVALAHPFNLKAPAQRPLLVVNLGNIAPAGFRYFLACVKEEVEGYSLGDRSRIDSLKNSILALVLDLSSWLPDAVKPDIKDTVAGSD